MPWVSCNDTIGALLYILGNPELRGPVNVCAPHPVTNSDFTFVLAAVLGKRPGPRMPAWAVRLALGEMANETLLTSQRVLPAKLLGSGYKFEFFYLEDSLRASRRLG